MSSDNFGRVRCGWPGCRMWADCTIMGKSFCDVHGNAVQAEDIGSRNRARKKAGLPPFKVFGRMPSGKEAMTRCCYPECGMPTSLIVEEKPLCNTHIVCASEVQFDGVWHQFVPGAGLKTTPVEIKPKECEIHEAEDVTANDAEEEDFAARLASGAFDWD